mgnify:CR=1 FL=1
MTVTNAATMWSALTFSLGTREEHAGQLVKAKKIQGISDIIDLSDGKNGTKMLVATKNDSLARFTRELKQH